MKPLATCYCYHVGDAWWFVQKSDGLLICFSKARIAKRVRDGLGLFDEIDVIVMEKHVIVERSFVKATS